MRTILRLVVTVFVAIAAANVAVAANYYVDGGCRIYCDNFTMSRTGSVTVPLLIDVPDYGLLKRGFQVDVTLPTGFQPVLSGGRYAVPAAGYAVAEYYNSSKSMLRLVFTASDNVAPIQRGLLATMIIKYVNSGSMTEAAQIQFSNYIHQHTAGSGAGHFGVERTATISPFVYPTALALNKTSLQMYVGDTGQLKATLQPSNCGSVITWRTSNSSVATVDAVGNVTAVGLGTATITAAVADKTVDGVTLIASCDVTVVRDVDLIADTLMHVRGADDVMRMVKVRLFNRTAISGVQFDLTLPNYLTLTTGSGGYQVWLADARKGRNHTVEVSSIGTKSYRVVISSPTNRTFSGNSGSILYFNVNIDKNHDSGTKYINFSNIVLAEPDETQYKISSMSTSVKFTYLVGDANADAKVDVADYVLTANKILQRSVTNFWSDAANANYTDSDINVTDLVAIIRIALELREKEYRPLSAPLMTPASGDVRMGVSENISGEECSTLSLSLTNDKPIAALQADLALPDGVTLQKAEVAGRAARHAVETEILPDGRTRLLVARFANDEIVAGDGDIVTLTLRGKPVGQAMATLNNIVAASRDLTTYYIDDAEIELVQTTGLANVNDDRHQVYVEDGMIAIDSPAEAEGFIAAIDGRNVPITVLKGHNVYPVAGHGVYIVRVGGIVKKLAL